MYNHIFRSYKVNDKQIPGTVTITLTEIFDILVLHVVNTKKKDHS